jgi:ribosomal protein S3AE
MAIVGNCNMNANRIYPLRPAWVLKIEVNKHEGNA